MDKVYDLGNVQKLISSKTLEKRILKYIAPYFKTSKITKDRSEEKIIDIEENDLDNNYLSEDDLSEDEGWDDFDTLYDAYALLCASWDDLLAERYAERAALDSGRDLC